MKPHTGILSILVLMMLLSACGSASSPPPTPAPSASPTGSAGVSFSDNPVIRLSTTTSVNDSGLLPYLQPYFEADTGYRLEITSAGTGAAIEKGRTGDADCLLVHAKASEEAFISEGYAAERVPFLYNFFVIVGPAEDPAGVANAANATEGFQAIAASGSPFVSRGDESGTHKAELKLWEAAGLTPDPAVDTWYISAGQGMGACLNLASQQQAYCLTDKGTYLAHEQRDTLKLLLEESDELKNTYSMLAISPEKWPDTNFDGANTFISWMQSEKAAELIRSYGVEEYGEPLFFLLNQ